MKVYKDFSSSDLYDLLVDYTSSSLHSYDLAEVIYDFLESCYEEVEETMIADFIRYDMEVQTEEEVKENYSNLIDEDDLEDFDVEDFLSYNTTYLGSFEEDDETFYVFTSF